MMTKCFRFDSTASAFTVILLGLFILSGTQPLYGQHTTEIDTAWLLPYEIDANTCLDHNGMVEFISKLSEASPYISIDTMGVSDGGHVIHKLMISDEKYSNGDEARQQEKVIFWLNNGIHPGEPAGIESSLAILRDYHFSGQLEVLVRDLVIIIIPAYNVDGMLNRNSHSRVNQNGPEAHGFRANARNLDLNRDFIKAKSKEAQSFNTTYTNWRPDVFLDTHTSNGADYQHTMTIIPTQADQLNGPKGLYMRTTLLPLVYDGMMKKEDTAVPYVLCPGGDPRKGIFAFMDSPRYSSGYAALFGSLSLMSETHMLKPFSERVESTYRLTEILLDFCLQEKEQLIYLRESQDQFHQNRAFYPLQYAMDTLEHDSIVFHGYALEPKHSDITGSDIRRYNRNRPFKEKVPYYSSYHAIDSIRIPSYYYIPRAWTDIIEHLHRNDVKTYQVLRDTMLKGEQYIIDAYSNDRLFEGQPYHHTLKLTTVPGLHKVYKGGILVPTRQKSMRYIIEALEPLARDSYFRWNYFDPILMRKEYYSDYLFEPLAVDILKTDEELKASFEAKVASDSTFASSPFQRLEYIYNHSPYKEDNYKQYPVLRLDMGDESIEDLIIK